MAKLIKGKTDLKTTNPDLAREWHPTKNGHLRSMDVTAGSGKKVWWLYPYDDPITGKHFDFEWQATIASRNKGIGCPFITGNSVWVGYNDFGTLYPELAREWHPQKNNGLTPYDVSAGSSKVVWWLYPYDDPITNKHYDFEWQASIIARIQGNGCPFLANGNPKVWKGYNDLKTVNPLLAAEWHPSKNGTLKADDVTAGSEKKVWWLYPYDDPNTGKHFDFEWQATVKDRNGKQRGCPYLANGNPKVWNGFNDLNTVNPELASEWHPTKNGVVTPSMVTAGSNRYAWWLCHRGHEWRAVINSRNQGRGCPYCSEEISTSFPEQAVFYYIKELFPDAINRYTDLGFEIDVFIPSYAIGIEYDGQYYHSNTDSDVEKDNKAVENHITLIRIREPNCPNLKSSSPIIQRKSLSYEDLEDAISRTICLVEERTQLKLSISIDIQRDYSKINSLFVQMIKEGSIANKYPVIAAEWDYTKNGSLTPETVLPGSTKLIWWKCSICGHEWRATPNSRTNTNGSRGRGCPKCGKAKQLESFNDTLLSKRGSLAESNPQLAAEWDYKHNRGLKPYDVTPHSKRVVWWICSKGHNWQAAIDSRAKNGCPYCSNKKVLIGFNDLASVNPDLASEWNYKRNLNLRNGNGELIDKPELVTAGSSQKVWWIGKCGHEWQAAIDSRSCRGYGCPFCSSKKVKRGFNDLETVNPSLAKEWHPTKNGSLMPYEVSAYSSKKVWWKYSYDDPNTEKHFDFEWISDIYSRMNGYGCPFLANGNTKVWKGFNDLETVNPSLAKEWHPTKNGDLRPVDVTAGSRKKVWWLFPYDDPNTGKHYDFEWEASISDRNSGSGCPFLASNPRVWRGFNDLATVDPVLALEWNYEKNYPLTPSDITSGSSKRVWWKCNACGFEWVISVANRKQGWGKCSQCKKRIVAP